MRSFREMRFEKAGLPATAQVTRWVREVLGAKFPGSNVRTLKVRKREVRVKSVILQVVDTLEVLDQCQQVV